MRIPTALFFLCSALAGWTWFWTGSLLSDLTLVALLLMVASLILLGRASLARTPRRGRKDHTWIMVDGSNVMHWKDKTPQIATVQAVVKDLKSRGFTPAVVFDANAGYKIEDRFMNNRDLARLLGLPQKQVYVVPKGSQADPYLLALARKMDARVVTNDRFRDWVDQVPEVKVPGFLVRGGYRDTGELWMESLTPLSVAA
jgi:rRNA-processing protein FCF1